MPEPMPELPAQPVDPTSQTAPTVEIPDPSDPPEASDGRDETLWSHVVASIRQNLVPGVALWTVGIAVVLGYFFVPAMRDALGYIAELKTRWGFLFSMVSTALFAGVIPFLFMAAVGQLKSDPYYQAGPARRLASLLVFGAVFWGLKGMEVDLLYRVQAWVWGEGSTPAVIVPKVFFDQFVYVPLYAAWTQTLVYVWKDHGFRVRTAWRTIDRDFWTFTVGAAVVANWLIWVPAVTCVYLMPSALQLPVQNLVLCFYVLMLSFIARGRSA